MDKAPAVIVSLEMPAYGQVIIETSTRQRYYSDLSGLSQTYCYPNDLDQWRKGSIDSYGLALVWQSRFEAHIDQIIGLAFKSEPVSESASQKKKHTG